MIMEKKTLFIQLKSTVTMVILVLFACAGVVYAGYESGGNGFVQSDIAKCLYFLMVGTAIVIVRRLRKKKSHIGNKALFLKRG